MHSSACADATALEAGQWSCSTHGSLPQSSFFPSDLMRGRHRCKVCVGRVKRMWREQHPWKLVWHRFTKRARRHFGKGLRLSWRQDALPQLDAWIQAAGELADSVNTARLMLVWSPGSEQPNVRSLQVIAKPANAVQQT